MDRELAEAIEEMGFEIAKAITKLADALENVTSALGRIELAISGQQGQGSPSTMKFEDSLEKVGKIIREHGSISFRDLSRNTSWSDRSQLEKCLSKLKDNEYVEELRGSRGARVFNWVEGDREGEK